jgi:hypothetical protein
MPDATPELGVAQLCASCQRAVFEDRFYPTEEELSGILSPEEAASYGSRPCIPTWYSFVEQLPELLKLDASARQGCDFCRFLRAIILSGDTNDLLIQVAGKSLADLGPLRVEINIAYGWKWRLRAGSTVGLMKVTLTIEGFESQIELQCFVEGVTGK